MCNFTYLWSLEVWKSHILPWIFRSHNPEICPEPKIKSCSINWLSHLSAFCLFCLLLLSISVSCMSLKKVDTQQMFADYMSGPVSCGSSSIVSRYLPSLLHFLCCPLEALPSWLGDSGTCLMVTLMPVFFLEDRNHFITFNSNVLNFSNSVSVCWCL